MRRDIRRLRQQVERYARSYEKRSDARRVDIDPAATQTAYRRLKQLQLVASHIESSAAYLVGSGLEPMAGHDDQLEVAQRVLESLEAERERLYRDVHDGPAQVLANAIFEVEYLERIAERVTGEPWPALRAELGRLKSQFRDSLESVRGMIFDLRPPILSELGLAGALRTYADEYESRYGLRIECDLDRSDTGLTPQQELAVYRVMQEALQNVHKHARAATVRLSWRREPKGWALRCQDDGVGFDLVRAARRPKSVGLLSMRERAELIAGSLRIDSAIGRGTTVTLLLPVGKEGSRVG